MKDFHLLLNVLALVLLTGVLSAQVASDSTKTDSVKLATKELPLEPTRQFQLTTSEGTWISLDVSPDGQQIVFDLLGDIYIMPINGGQAKQVIGDLSFETHPKWSPDGKMLAFTTDRSGSENIWTYDIDSSDWHQVTKDKDKHYQSAEWTPDGEYIIAAKGNRNLKMHMYHKSGGGGVQLIKEPAVVKTIEPAFGKDERYIWMSTRRGAWNYNAQLPQYQLATYDRETGEVERKTSRYGSAFAPTLSPDGEWLVYVTRHNAKTGLVKRNLQSGEESWLAYPVQRDDQESIATLGVYPAMSFTPDSKSLVASYGGKIHKIDIQSNSAIEIPFEVKDTINYGPRVKFDYAISDDPQMEVTQIRDLKVSPDGSQIAFTALNRLYVADYPNGAPRRVTSHEFTEAMPTWSPDGKQLVFTSWEGTEGNLYKVNAKANATPIKLTQKAGYFVFPNWDANTDRVIFLKGTAQTFVDAVDPFYYGSNEKYSWIAASGGEIHDIDHRHGRSNPHFVKGKKRIYLHDPKNGLVSIRWDGTDKKEHVKITGVTTYPAELGHSHCLMVASETEPAKKPSTASILTMAPSGKYVLAQVNNEIYRVMVPMVGGKTPVINVASPEKALFPAEKVTDIGGEFAHWSGDGSHAYYSLGNAVFDYDFAEAKKINDALKKKKEADKKKKEESAKKKKSEKSDSKKEEKGRASKKEKKRL